MSGHSKWSTIKHKKGAADAKRGKAFSRIAKELMLATKMGGKDPDLNIRLRSAITSAKAANMPKDVIERAIKKGAGELDGQEMVELSYEGYAPGGVAVMVDCLSDNRNRTAAEVRNIFNKNQGNLATSGAVAWMFHRKARFVVEGEHADEDALMELCFEADVDVEEINIEDGTAEIIAPADTFDQVATCLEAAGIAATESTITRLPETDTPVTDVGTAKQVLRLLDLLEDEDDVQQVYCNAEIDESILEQLAED
jgi:YebC/PmpR family DNA-binding regulatory protein